VAIERAPDVERLLRDVYAQFQSGDADAFLRLISSDPSTHARGSDPEERKDGPDAFAAMVREDVAGRGDAPPLASLKDVVAYREGDVAWASLDIDFHRERDEVPFRATAVLHREDAEWRIVQWTVALLVRNERFEAAWPPA
jgi:ketosteroid isomerase-like protein